MSGFEVAGLVLGIIPLLEQTFEKAKAFKKRCEDFRKNTRKIISIQNRLKTVLDDLQALQEQFGGKRLAIPRENAAIFEQDFNALGHTLTELTNLLESISGPNAPAYSRRSLFKFTRANKIKETCEDISSNLEKASDKLRYMNHFLSTAAVIETRVGHVCERQDEILNTLRNVQKDALDTSTREDTYTPSFVIPVNPAIARECLDYTTVDEEGLPETYEGKLKAALLRGIDIRREHDDKLPVLGAVGMPGVGKTCALRGLGAEKDLKDRFTDGVLYFSLGKDARDTDVREALCSIVAQTGGNSLSQEMKKISGEKSIDLIVIRVASWFKGRKCLFLLDDVWNGEKTGSSLLLRLSTVIKHCDKCSGLVYTTRDLRINPFQSVVRFNSLMPNSSTCLNILVKAAGFSHDEVEEARCEEDIEILLESCNGLKMALVVAGTNVGVLAESYGEYRWQAWRSYVSTLQSFPQKLLREDCSEYRSLHSQFSAALQTLSLTADKALVFKMRYSIEEAFEALCLARKKEVLSDTMLRRLWDLESELQARELARHFASVSMVEVIPLEFVDGRFVEGIYVHDLVHDFANHLADQRPIYRRWVKGWEVWALRLLENYFAVEKEIYSDVLQFYQWWEHMNKHDSYFRYGLERIIAKIAKESRTEDGQHLSKYSDRYINFCELAVKRVRQGIEVLRAVIFPILPRESIVPKTHEIVSTLSEERGIKISELTHRVLVFACLVILRLDKILAESGKMSQSFVNDYVYEICKAEEKVYPREVLYVKFVYPQIWEYVRHATEYNWMYYEECLRTPKVLSDEEYDLSKDVCLEDLGRSMLYEENSLIGVPLSEGRLNNAGIDFSYIIHALPITLGERRAVEYDDVGAPGPNGQVRIEFVCGELLKYRKDAVIFEHKLEDTELSSRANSWKFRLLAEDDYPEWMRRLRSL